MKHNAMNVPFADTGQSADMTGSASTDAPNKGVADQGSTGQLVIDGS